VAPKGVGLGMAEASAADVGDPAATAGVAVVMATAVSASATTETLAYLGMACFSTPFRSITRRCGGPAVRTITRMTTTISGTVLYLFMKRYGHP